MEIIIIITFILSIINFILCIIILYAHKKKWEWEMLQDKDINDLKTGVEKLFEPLGKDDNEKYI